MDWERAHRQLLKVERLVIEAEANLVRARQAIRGPRDESASTIKAELILRCLEASLQHDIELRDRLKDQLRLLTN